MDEPSEPQRRTPASPLRFIGQLAWALLWVIVAFAMVIFGLCGLNFIAVGLLALCVDTGDWGPSINGHIAETLRQKLAFIGVGAVEVGASIGFFWLNAQKRDGASVVLFIVVIAVLAGLAWATGIHDLSDGIGSVGFGGR